MKYCCLLMVVFVLATLVVVEAKKKPNNNKFEGDFEFVDEVSHKILYSLVFWFKKKTLRILRENKKMFYPFLGLISVFQNSVCVCVYLKGLQNSIHSFVKVNDFKLLTPSQSS